MKQVDYEQACERLARHLRVGGAFLTVGGPVPNTMTIGWAQVGWMWKRPTLTVLVRPSRHTFEMLNRAGFFTVSVPDDGALQKELAYAGTASGRDENKFVGHGLTPVQASEGEGVIVGECHLHFECRVRYTSDMTPDAFDDSLRPLCYPEGDYHRMYFGEIVACYET